MNKDPFTAMWGKATDIKITTTGILLVGAVLPFAGALYKGYNGLDTLKMVGMVLVNTTLLWLGCRRIVHYLAVRLPWQHYPVIHLVAELLMIGGMTLVVSTSLHTLMRLSGFVPPREVFFWREYAASTIISIIITLLHEGVFFYQQWKTNLIRSESLEKENIASRYETLKNQVNPHFLFNSFNTLLSLIEEDKAAAITYLESLSEFYRRILQSAEKSLITLQEELEMITDYYEIQHARFGDAFVLDIKVPENYMHTMVAPLTLQMLVENALKHNTASAKNPLKVNITISESDYIVVGNNMNKRSGKQPGAGMGLNNIVSRYGMVSEKEVMINNSGTDFTVAIPVIAAENPDK
jgi:sensor histidine kinase YesM